MRNRELKRNNFANPFDQFDHANLSEAARRRLQILSNRNEMRMDKGALDRRIKNSRYLAKRGR